MDLLATPENSYNRLEHKDPRHRDIFVVNWCLANVCNYSCSYCPDELHNHSVPFPELASAMAFADKVRQQTGARQVYFEFTGGEVTLWKDLPRLLEHLKSLGFRTGIISNASRAPAWWEKNHPLLDHVCLSFHSEFAKAEHFLATARFLAPRLSLHCNVMMSPRYFDACVALARQLAEIPDVTLALQPLIIDFNDRLYPYRPDHAAILKSSAGLSHRAEPSRERFSYRGQMVRRYFAQRLDELGPHELIAQGQNRWRGWKCFAGVEQIVVDFHGRIYRGWCQVGGRLGTIADEKIDLPLAPVVCDKEFCHCNVDVMTTKVK